jgi:transposase
MMSTASSYAEVNEQGLLKLGHRKDHRPDLPQLKLALASLDPLGMPLATEVVSGEKADDPLYLPLIARVRSGQQILTFLGFSPAISVRPADDSSFRPTI